MSDANNAVARYIAAWNERDDNERNALIAATYTDDATYVDPARNGKGHDGISSMIAAVHKQFPPAYRFRLKGTVDAYQNRARFQWEAGGLSDAPLHFVGTDVIEMDGDGRIRTVTGFVDEAPKH
jgi:hypothetical protein